MDFYTHSYTYLYKKKNASFQGFSSFFSLNNWHQVWPLYGHNILI